jgi:hypothetical protein
VNSLKSTRLLRAEESILLARGFGHSSAVFFGDQYESFAPIYQRMRAYCRAILFESTFRSSAAE